MEQLLRLLLSSACKKLLSIKTLTLGKNGDNSRLKLTAKIQES